jgi:prepilin signal peptidase PulO-like enzyme (type II secretory pathway)
MRPVDVIVSMPIEVRLALLGLAGLLLGRQLNRAIYQLAWLPRPVGPWSPPPAAAPPRHRLDLVPVVGWWRLRRESRWHGRGYWIRPLLLELLVGVGCAVLYWGEIERHWLWPTLPGIAPPTNAVLHAQFLAHIILLSLMLVATFIDFDEQTIPDAITVSGAVAGLLLAVALPRAALPTIVELWGEPAQVCHVVLTSSTLSRSWRTGLGGPHSWPEVLDQTPGLVLALTIIWSSCLAVLHKTCTLRRGLGMAMAFMVASVVRHRTWPLPATLGCGLSLLAVSTWLIGATRWESLLSALVGLAFAGGLIWSVRIIAGRALGVEAMGFGDVTLMAMIGTFLGWQAAFLVFFLAPLTAVVIATAQWLLTGERRIAFGPYLCLAAVIVVLGWEGLWSQWAHPMFSLGWFIPIILGACLLLMGGLLWGWRLVRDTFF